MRLRILTFLTAMVLVGITATPAQLAAQTQQKNHQAPKYYVFNLGAPGGGTSAAAASINRLGWIAGDALQTGNVTEHAELWIGAPIDLGTLGGPNSAVAWPNKNNKGQIAGISETADLNGLGEDWSCALANFPTITNHICLGFIWQDGVMSPLPPLPGGLNSYASGINNRGQVVGWAENSVHESTCVSPQVLQFEAVIWGPKLGEVTQLPPLPGDLDGAATAINDKGQIVGISGICDQSVGRFSAKHAALWDKGVPLDLGNFDGGQAWNTPTAINNRGQVTGFVNQKGTQGGAFDPIAFFWDKDRGIQPIAPLGSDTSSWAWGINNHGVVVGQSGFQRAFFYQDGETTDLNTLIQPNSSLDLLLANDINDDGEIVGFATDTNTGATVAFLAVPVQDGGGSEATAAARPEGNSRKVITSETLGNQSTGFSRFPLGVTRSR
jgi:probable HAF family extracellular repeat protein